MAYEQADFSGFSKIGEAYLRGRDIRDQREREQMDRFREDNRIERQERDRKIRDRDNTLEKLGADAVVDPNTGDIDVAKSVLKRQQRIEAERIAESAGELEGLGMKQDIPEELRSHPSYRVGQSRALAKVQGKKLEHDYEMEIERAREARYRGIEELRQQGLNNRAGSKPDRSDDISEVEEDPVSGTKTTRRFASEEEYNAYKANRKPATPAKKSKVDEAMEAFDRATAAGKSGRLVEKGNDDVSFEETSIRPDNPAIVKRRLEQLKRREGGAKKQPRVIRFEDLNIR